MVPEGEAKKTVNGLGRDIPNNFPVLEPPKGRFKFNLLDPCGMLKEIVGPEIFYKMIGSICCILAIAFGLYFGWGILQAMFAKMIIG